MIKKTLIAVAAFLGFAMVAPAAEPAPYPQITNISARKTISLNGDWRTLVDLYEEGAYDYRGLPKPLDATFFKDRNFFDDETTLVEYDFNVAPLMKVPGDWNTQRQDLFRDEGTVWYRTTFKQLREAGKRYFVYFGAANYSSLTGLNGNILGKHLGGFTPFNYEITDILREDMGYEGRWSNT